MSSIDERLSRIVVAFVVTSRPKVKQIWSEWPNGNGRNDWIKKSGCRRGRRTCADGVRSFYVDASERVNVET